MEPILGEIKLFAGPFAPNGWFYCDGSILSIAQNTALFSLLGTTYGGNGTSTFALPDLRGRVPVHAGSGPGPGLQQVVLGQVGGTATNTLNTQNMPAHNHPLAGTAQLMAANTNGDSIAPTGVLSIVNDGQRSPTQHQMYSTATPDTKLSTAGITGDTGISGSNMPVNNMQPFLGLNYIIAWQGIYPQRP